MFLMFDGSRFLAHVAESGVPILATSCEVPPCCSTKEDTMGHPSELEICRSGRTHTQKVQVQAGLPSFRKRFGVRLRVSGDDVII